MLPEYALSATPLDELGQEILAGNFVTAALLSDEDVMRLGFWDFDPNAVLGTDDDQLGNSQTLETRDSLKQFNLPWKWPLDTGSDDSRLWLLTRLAYLQVEQDVRLAFPEQAAEDEFEQRVMSAGAGLGYLRALNDHWQIQLEANLSWMHYRNRVDFSPDAQWLAPLLDETFTNYSADLVMAEPVLSLHYNWQALASRWRLYSRYHYLWGESVNPDNAAQDVRPEAWYWSHGIGLRRPLNVWHSDRQHSLWLRLARVDVGGDLSDQLGSDDYLELGIGWLVDTSDQFEWLDNVGVGIDFNYGSDLRGGTLMLLFNIDDY